MLPFKLRALIGETETDVSPIGNTFTLGNVTVICMDSGEILVTAENEAPKKIRLFYRFEFDESTLFLGDAWERGYGDLCFKPRDEKRYMPWYFLATNGRTTHGFGVKTGGGAFAHWNVYEKEVVLTLDIRNGTRPTRLNGRTLRAAETVFYSSEKDVFDGARELCSMLCESPILPKAPVYGGNDWYCNYSNNSFDNIARSASHVSECAHGLSDRPFMVIDDGWQLNRLGGYNGGPWRYPNSKFNDMSAMAKRITDEGAIPGIWLRPLLTMEYLPRECILSAHTDRDKFHLDPSHPETLNYVASETKALTDFGYKLLKYDFTSYDILGRYGISMDENVTAGDWGFFDNTKTTAEIIKSLYRTIKTAAGQETLLIGCNTVGHLGAGLFEIQRTGDDTSGREWERTRKMGVNTLAFRMPQHGTFFAADADCVGITDKVPWEKNSQWLDVLAQSGTPLFVSAAENCRTEEINAALKSAFETSVMVAKSGEVLRPLDWTETLTPRVWQRGEKIFKYNWD